MKISSLRSLAILLILFSINAGHAEGTKEVSPTADDWVLLNLTQGFAGYGTGGTDKAMSFEILDPNEKVHLALSQLVYANYRDISSLAYEFRIVNSQGNIVHGPFSVSPQSANGNDYQKLKIGPNLGNGGYDISNPIFTFTPFQTGTYSIEFKMPAQTTVTPFSYDNHGIFGWDISVVDQNNNIKSGRLYSKNWDFRTPSNTPPKVYDQAFNGKIFVLTNTGFVYQVDFQNSGFRGLSFALAFNGQGPGISGNPTEDRRSVDEENATNPEFKIFLNDPEPSLYTLAQIGGVISGPNFKVNGQCQNSDSVCIEYEITQPGLVEVILDFDGNDGIYTPNSADRLILHRASPAGNFNQCLNWDQKDGNGNTIDPETSIPVYLRYYQGELHFMMYDVEYNNPGFKVQLVHPVNGSLTNKLFYDDSSLAGDDMDVNLDGDDNENTGIQPPSVDLNGCAPPCHIWNSTSTDEGYGESNTINTWWAGSEVTYQTVVMSVCQDDDYHVTKRVVDIQNATSGIDENYDVTFEFFIKNTGDSNLKRLQMTDDFQTQFGLSFVRLVSGPNISAHQGTPQLPLAYSDIGQKFFDGNSGMLAPGETIKVVYTIEVNPDATGDFRDFTTQATTTAFTDANNLLNRLSDDPTVLGPNDDPTVVKLPKIGISKRIVTLPAPAAASGSSNHYDVIYEAVIKNIGDVRLNHIQVTEDLVANLGGAFIALTQAPQIIQHSTVSGNVNPSFAGRRPNISLLDGNAQLDPGEEIVIQLGVELAPFAAQAIYHASGHLANQIQVSATNLFGASVSDLSDSGTNPNDDLDTNGANTGSFGDTGGTDDPTLFPIEICNNSIDDNGDGMTDCDDNHCKIQIQVQGDCDGMIINHPKADWTFQWLIDGQLIIGADEAFYVPTSAQYGAYSVQVTNGFGCTATSATIVTCCNPTEPSMGGN